MLCYSSVDDLFCIGCLIEAAISASVLIWTPFSFLACQKNVHSTRFVTYFCEHVLPNLSALASPVAELDIQLEVSQGLRWRC